MPDPDSALQLVGHVLVRVVAHEDGLGVRLAAEVVGLVPGEEVAHVVVLLAVEL